MSLNQTLLNGHGTLCHYNDRKNDFDLLLIIFYDCFRKRRNKISLIKTFYNCLIMLFQINRSSRLHTAFALLFLSFVFSHNIFSQTISFEGNDLKIIEITPENASGLNSVYVAFSTENLKIIYTSSSNQTVEWSKYSNMGGGYAEEIRDIVKDGNSYIYNNPQGDCGYLIKEGDITYNFWLVDYSKHYLRLDKLEKSAGQDCNETTLDFAGDATPINYYGINGRQFTLSRDLSLDYQNLYFNEQNKQFELEQTQKILESINTQIVVTPPNYCNTNFILSGDRFLQEWEMPIEVESPYIAPYAVNVATDAKSEDSGEGEEGSNMIHPDTDGLGGSAPATIEFISYVTDAVMHYEWQIAADEEFNYITYRFNEQDLTYTFNEEGVYYVRFIGSNSDGSCEAIGDVYKVSIGSSQLLIPNAFSPNDDGVNDIWKVSYRSLLEFKCWIYDKQGHQIYYYEDPAGGWNGYHNGKKVKPGVYFYVIHAKGADGINYKRSGDINILNYKQTGNFNPGSGSE